MRCAAGRLAEVEAGELLDLLLRVDELDDLARLFGLLSSPRERRPGASTGTVQ